MKLKVLSFLSGIKINYTSIATLFSVMIIVTSVTVGSIIGGISYAQLNKTLLFSNTVKLQSILDARRQTFETQMDFWRSEWLRFSRISIVQSYNDFNLGWRILGPQAADILRKSYIEDNPFPGDLARLKIGLDGSRYSAIHDDLHNSFVLFFDQPGILDILLINLDGDIIYSMNKTELFGLNLNEVEFEGTNIEEAFFSSLEVSSGGSASEDLSAIRFADFIPISNYPLKIRQEFNEPIGVFSLPIRARSVGIISGELMIIVSSEWFNQYIAKHEGLGRTGQVFTINIDDGAYRSQDRFAIEKTILKHSLLGVESGSVEVAGADKANLGQSFLGSMVDNDSGIATIGDEGDKSITLFQKVRVFDKFWTMIVQQKEEEIFYDLFQTRRLIIVTILAAILVVSLIAFLLARRITTPLKRIIYSMQNVEQGIFDKKILYVDRVDEVGEIARALLSFRQAAEEKVAIEMRENENLFNREQRRVRIENLIIDFHGKVLDAIGSMGSATKQLSTVSENMRGIALETTNQSKIILEEINETTNNVRMVASSVDEMRLSIDEITQKTSDSRRVIGETVDRADNVDSSAQSLATASEDIGSIVQLIQDIAGQVNLLALNATIEAARAGKAGKGFAVVASEVKNLANQTTDATDQISGLIGNVQNTSGDVVGFLEDIKESIGKTSDVVTSISDTINQQKETSDNIAINMVDATKRVEKIQQEFEEVSNSIRTSEQYSLEVLGASKMVSDQSAFLKGEIQEFLNEIQKA